MQQPSVINQRYRIIDFLGSGGFGETYLVEDLEMPSKRWCVLKCLKPIVDDAATYELIQQQFLREATILETLGSQHPQIPTLYAYFQKAGRFYLVQEWIDGRTLLELVQTAGPMPPQQVRVMLDRLLAILEYVHSQRIIHRDIKPDNIILRTGDLAPVLLDFGAVKEAMSTAIRHPQASKSTLVVGTPGFMPSEQSVGRPVYSSDLYALGLTALYALTQKLPDSFASDPATGKLLWRHEVPDLDPGLAAVIEQAIEPYPPHRFATAQHMRTALASPSAATPPASPGVPSQVATVVAAPRYVSTDLHAPAAPDAPQTQRVRRTPRRPRSDGRKAVLTGGIIGGFIFLGLVVTRLPFFGGNQSDPAEEAPQTTATAPQSENAAPPAVAPVDEVSPAPEAVPGEEGEPIEPSPSVRPQEPAQDEASPADAPPAEEPPPENGELDASTSAAVVESLYGAIAAENWDTAAAYFSPDASPPFDPGFFQQFDQVTVSNLRVTSQTDSSITLVGENTYVWPDGSTQREERSYIIRSEAGQALISDSAFIRMIEARN